ncbi:MAG: DUF1905 domain-containing protein [Pontixanthobacter sp.]
MTETITHTANLWRWTANNGVSWFFLTIDGEAGEALSGTALMRRLENGTKRGWGGIKVSAKIGGSEWQTSVFPQKAEDGWLLPVKAAIRKAEAMDEGSEAAVTLRF